MTLTVEFTKMDGAGNDFIVIDNRFYHYSDEELERMAKTLCPRRTGIGADGLIALGNPVNDGSHLKMTYFNADGSRGMCGNGARCLIKYAVEAEILADRYVLETDSGIYYATVSNGMVTLFVPDPERYDAALNLELRDEMSDASFLWTGTDHVVIFAEDLSKVDVRGVGRTIRNAAVVAPAGANVNFVSAQDAEASEITVRTYERGVEEETLACGTGAMAAAIVSHLKGKAAAPPIVVHMPGGDLVVDFDLKFDLDSNQDLAPGIDIRKEGQVTNLSLSGPSNINYRGSFQMPAAKSQ